MRNGRDAQAEHSQRAIRACRLPGRAVFFSAIPLAILALTLLPFLIYQPGIGGDFILDDTVSIPTAIPQTLSTYELGKASFVSSRFNGWSRSVTNLSFALTQFASGRHAPSFKYQNVALHALNGLLVFWLTYLLLPILTPASKTDPAYTPWLALLIAAAWVLHPIQVSTVLYAVQRLVLLSAAFSLICIIAYIKARIALRDRCLAAAALWLAVLPIALALGLMSKENAVLVLPSLILIEWLGFNRDAAAWKKSGRKTVISFFYAGLALLIASGIYLLAEKDVMQVAYAGRDFNLPERLMTQLHALWLYIKLTVIPIPSLMGLFHDDFPVQRAFDLGTALALLGHLTMIGVAIAFSRRAPLIALGIFWFYCWHAVESSIIPLEMVFEHRNYLASLGVIYAVSGILRVLFTTIPNTRIIAAFAVALVATLSLTTMSRAFEWSSYELQVRVEYEKSPNSVRATEAMFILANNRGDRAEAQRLLESLQRLSPNNAWPLLLEVLFRCAEPDVEPGLFRQTLTAARNGIMSPAYVVTLERLERAKLSGACPAMSATDIQKLASAAAANPRVHHPNTTYMADVLLAAVATRNGDYDASIAALRSALAYAATDTRSTLRGTALSIARIATATGTAADASRFIRAVTHGYEDALASADASIDAPRQSEWEGAPSGSLRGPEFLE